MGPNGVDPRKQKYTIPLLDLELGLDSGTTVHFILSPVYSLPQPTDSRHHQD